MRIAIAALLFPLMSQAANYLAKTAQMDGVEVARLFDTARKTEVVVVPSVGNIGYRMLVNGKNAFWVPYDSIAEMASKPAMGGAPFLAPWANRLDHDGYWANGKQYRLNPDLANIGRDANGNPIHGLLRYSALWQVVELRADEHAAWVTSRLEFWKYPELMAQFPFAHTIEMTHRLANGVLQVETGLLNQSNEPMPVGVGYHPYFQVHDAPRDEWTVHVAARDKFTLSDKLVPTGERSAVSFADPLPLKGTQLDDVFGNLKTGSDGRAEFFVQGKRERVTVTYGPKYTVAVVYAPPGKSFVCFEPMAGITNAFNLAHEGIYKDLQSVPAGGQWRESFWIAPSGF